MILVTGASGLLGTHLLQALTQQGKPVRALYHTTAPVAMPGVEWVQGNVLDILSLEDAMQGVQQVYHCAGMVSFSPKNKQQLFKVNVEGTANVVNAALDAGIDKLLFVSSVAALGRLKEGEIITEEMHWEDIKGNSQYGKSKYLAEMEVWRGIGEGLNAVIVNPSIILGAGDWNKGSTEIFQTIYKEFPWYTEGVSGFVHVKDVVRAMIALMDSDISGERFILNSENITYKQLFDDIAQQFGKKPPRKKVTPFMAAIVWRIEAIKAKLTGKDPLLTKETAHTAQSVIRYSNSKLLQFLPQFHFTSVKESVQEICNELKKKHNL